jgi:hypothetical protein
MGDEIKKKSSPLKLLSQSQPHLEWRAGLSDTILKGTHPGTIPARFGLIWFSGFRGEDLNAIFYQNMPNFVRLSRLPTKMAAKLKIEKRGDEILIVHCCFSVSQNELKF